MTFPKLLGGGETRFRPPNIRFGGATAPLAPLNIQLKNNGPYDSRWLFIILPLTNFGYNLIIWLMEPRLSNVPTLIVQNELNSNPTFSKRD